MLEDCIKSFAHWGFWEIWAKVLYNTGKGKKKTCYNIVALFKLRFEYLGIVREESKLHTYRRYMGCKIQVNEDYVIGLHIDSIAQW